MNDATSSPEGNIVESLCFFISGRQISDVITESRNVEQFPFSSVFEGRGGFPAKEFFFR